MYFTSVSGILAYSVCHLGLSCRGAKSGIPTFYRAALSLSVSKQEYIPKNISLTTGKLVPGMKQLSTVYSTWGCLRDILGRLLFIYIYLSLGWSIISVWVLQCRIMHLRWWLLKRGSTVKCSAAQLGLWYSITHVPGGDSCWGYSMTWPVVRLQAAYLGLRTGWAAITLLITGSSARDKHFLRRLYTWALLRPLKKVLIQS